MPEQFQISRQKLRNTLLRDGLPDVLRGGVWKLISKIPLKRHQYNSKLFEQLLSNPCSDEDEYCIGKDLSRTIKGFDGFKINPSSGKNRLYNVLKAYSNFDKEVGYC